MTRISERPNMSAEEELISALEKTTKFKLIPGTPIYKLREKTLKEIKKYRENQNKIKGTS